MTRTYLDHNATTPLHPAARAAMAAAFDVHGNPSSMHAEGRNARAIVDDARRAVAALTGVAAEDVVFTSGGTEALNLVLSPDLEVDGKPFDILLMSAGEHPAVLAGHRFGSEAETVPLTRDGTLDLAALQSALALREGTRVVLALQAANNETGVIQPVAAASEMVHAAGGFVVCDAVQAAGKIDCDIKSFGADALAVSAHKFGGPKGVGALCFGPTSHHLKRGVVRGGGQERGLRAGTENVVGIAGMGAAAQVAEAERRAAKVRLEGWRQAIEQSVLARVPGAVVHGSNVRRLPNTSCMVVPGYDAQVLLMNMDLNGVAISGGSACAAGKIKPSHVLTAMGLGANVATSTLRVSTGWSTTSADIAAFTAAFDKAIATMRPRAAA